MKGHYYGPTFYNYPYLFGLYARYRKEPDAFRADYDAFLSSTGLADAVTLAKRFHIDIQSLDFWRSRVSKEARRCIPLPDLPLYGERTLSDLGVFKSAL